MIAAFLTILIYLPFSLYLLGHLVSVVSFEDFFWGKVHGDGWGIAVKFAQPTAPATSWIGIILSTISILLLATSTKTKKRCASCLDWLDTHLTSTGSQPDLHNPENPRPTDHKLYTSPFPYISFLNSFRTRFLCIVDPTARVVR